MGPQGKEVILSNGSSGSTRIAQKTYSFDQVFGAESDQDLVFNVTTKDYIQEMLDGYNCTVFAYGQTGTGKTYTMSGDINVLGDRDSPQVLLGEHAGIIPRVLTNLFQRLSSESNDFSVKISFLELYNEKLTDLLATEDNEEETIRIFDNHASAQIPRSSGQHSTTSNQQRHRQSGDAKTAEMRKTNAVHGADKGTANHGDSSNAVANNNKSIQRNLKASANSAIIVKGMEEIYIKSAYEGLQLLTEGSLKRKVAATKCNDLSSRSHTIFTITTNITKTDPISGEQYVKIGKLNLVDLAGSENINRSGAENLRAQEAGLINKSLLTLGRVINALVDYSQHVPYRESKLTRLLQDSLGGKTKTCIIATISPAKISAEETVSTLEYAMRAKSIKNSPQVNQSMSKDVCLNEYVREIERLRHALKTSRLKDGIYVSQDQYELYESNEILLTEQKMRIHNMEEQTNRFKQEYVKQTTINKDLESKIKEVETSIQGLQEQKVLLMDFIRNYETSTSKYVKEVHKVHKNNNRVIDDLVGERNYHFENSNDLKSKLKDLQRMMLHEENAVKQLGDDLNENITNFVTHIMNTNGNLQERNNSSYLDMRKSLTYLNAKQDIDLLTSVQTEIDSILRLIMDDTDDSIKSPYSAHRTVIEECFKRVSEQLAQCTETFNDDIENTITSVRNSIKDVHDEHIKGQDVINATIAAQQAEISRLMTAMKKKNDESSELKDTIKEMKNFFEENVNNERNAIFSELNESIERFKDRQIHLDLSIFSHTKNEVELFGDRSANEHAKDINDITTASLASMSTIQQNVASTNSTVSNLIKKSSDTIPSEISRLSIMRSINSILERLANSCGEDASKPLLVLLDNFKNDRDNKQIMSIEKIRTVLVNLKERTNEDQNENLRLISGLESYIDTFYQYVSNEYSADLNEVTKSQKKRLDEFSDDLRGVHSRLQSNSQNDEHTPDLTQSGMAENARIVLLPRLENPSNSEACNSLLGENKLDTTIEGMSLDNISPVHLSLSGIKFNPSTPVPVPDQPLPLAKVLMPRSVNAQNSRSYTMPMMLKHSPNRVSSPLKANNLKRRFTLEPTESDLAEEREEDNEVANSRMTPRKRLQLEENHE